MAITSKELNLAEDAFKLQHLLDANLLAHRDAVEELCSAAVKVSAATARLDPGHPIAIHGF